MATRIKLRRDTAANWNTSNPILAQGETGFETDTRAMKLGDGVTKWRDLKYAVTGDLKVTGSVIHGDQTVGISSGMGEQTNWIMTIHTNNGDISDPSDGYTSSVAYDSKGNVFAIGGYNTTGGPGGADGMFLMKTDPNGQVIFNNYYYEYYAFGFAMIIDKNDDVLFVMGEFDPSSADTVLVKVSGEDGTIMWQKYLADTDPTSDDVAICVDIDPTSNDVIIAGTTATSSNYDFWVGKFSGATGASIWQKQYDQDGCYDAASGLAVDSNGDIGIVGNSWGEGTFLPVYKLSGADGSIIWQRKVIGAMLGDDNGWIQGNCYSADMCVDSNNDFYFNLTGVWCTNWTVTGLHKISGTDGASIWSKVISYTSYSNGSSSIICDDQNNVYTLSTIWWPRQPNTVNDFVRRNTSTVTKFNSTGTKIWSKSLLREHSDTRDSRNNSGDYTWFGQTIDVQGDYVVMGGQVRTLRDSYDGPEGSSAWYDYPFIAQIDRDGTAFDVDGWKLYDAEYPIFDMTIILDVNNEYLNDLTSATPDIVVSTGDVGFESNTDTTGLTFMSRDRVKTMTLDGSTLKLPKNGTLEIARAKKGYITAIGNFDGAEGGNTDGNVWLNAADRDAAGNTYSGGGQYRSWNGDWANVPMVYKTDSEGKLVWQAGNALDQSSNGNADTDVYGVAYNPTNNTVVAVSIDGEMDGHEGFNVSFLNADTGSMTQDIIHIRPAEGDNDLLPTGVRLMSDGTPVVSGYISGVQDEFLNVTNGAAGLTGSADGTLVILKSKFDRDDSTYSIEYPKEDGTWYIGSTQINHVNHYGDDEAFTTGITYTGILGTGATFNVSVSGGAWTGIAIVSGGAGYKPGQKVKILGSALGGTTPTNDLYLFVDTVDGSGTITDLTGDTIANTIPSDGGPYTAVASVAIAGSGLTGWVKVDPVTNTYTFNKNSNGTNYGVGDTLKIIGSDLGGTDVTHDLTITVTSIDGTGNGYGGITGFTIVGTSQGVRIKLHANGTDFTQAGTYNIYHQLSNDGFIWTPNWHLSFGSDGNNYDDIHSITIDSDDNIIVSGYSDNTGLNSGTTWDDNNYQTGIISKYNSQGVNQWSVSIDGSEGASTVWSVDTDADNNIYSAMCNDYREDLFVTKLNSAGELVWQVVLDMWNSNNTWSISVADNGDVLVAGRGYVNDFDTDYHHYNSNILIFKFDSDGNLLFSRALWSTNGLRTCRHDYVSNQLMVKGDRFSFVAHSDDPGNGDDYQGIVVDLPLDGSGIGDYGDFHYEVIELTIRDRFAQNELPSGDNIVTPITLSSRANAMYSDPYTNNYENVTEYSYRPHEVQTVYEPTGAEIKGVAKVTFEDGTEQTTSAQGLPQVKMSQVNSEDYWIRPEDNGKHLYVLWNRTIYIPARYQRDLPVGFAFTIITESNECGVVSYDYDEDIYGSGFNGDNDNSWTIPSHTMVTLVKLRNGRWMIAGPGISTGW